MKLLNKLFRYIEHLLCGPRFFASVAISLRFPQFPEVFNYHTYMISVSLEKICLKALLTQTQYSAVSEFPKSCNFLCVWILLPRSIKAGAYYNVADCISLQPYIHVQPSVATKNSTVVALVSTLSNSQSEFISYCCGNKTLLSIQRLR